MSDPSEICKRATRYATTRGFQLKHPLGFGKDGSVFSTTTGRAVKVFANAEVYRRELACYSSSGKF